MMADQQYYHNVSVICIALSPYWWDQFYPNLDEIWDTQRLTSARRQAIWVYRGENIDEEQYDWEIYHVPHAVVAIGNDNSVMFFKEESPWKI